MFSNKPKQPATNLTLDSSGNLLKSPEEVVKTWGNFLSEKIATTTAERARPSMSPLPKIDDTISRQEFDEAVRRLKTGKAIGPDGVPAAVFKTCPLIMDELFKLLQFMWTEEVVPKGMVTAKFKMFFKNKGPATIHPDITA